MKKLLSVILGLLLLAGPLGAPAVRSQEPTGRTRVVSILGVAKVEGQDTVVEILVAVHPGENASEKARATLRRVYPDARPLGSADYSFTGLVWDVFSDSDPSNDKVDVYYNASGVPSDYPAADYLNAFRASQTTWTDVPSSTFVFNDAGTTTRCPSLVRECPGRQKFDGNNDVGWLAINEPDVLGVTWFGTQRDEFDMVLDNVDFSWYVGPEGTIAAGQIDAETVWLHEFGHGAGLGHSEIQEAVMFAYYGGVRRALHTDDVSGLSALYPSGAPTPTPEPGETVTVDSITYSRYGGKNNDRHLNDKLTLEDNNQNPVSGASVSITLSRDAGQSWIGNGTTGSDGSVTFTLKNAPGGCYTTTVQSVTASGMTWDGATPPNQFCF